MFNNDMILEQNMFNSIEHLSVYPIQLLQSPFLALSASELLLLNFMQCRLQLCTQGRAGAHGTPLDYKLSLMVVTGWPAGRSPRTETHTEASQSQAQTVIVV